MWLKCVAMFTTTNRSFSYSFAVEINFVGISYTAHLIAILLKLLLFKYAMLIRELRINIQGNQLNLKKKMKWSEFAASILPVHSTESFASEKKEEKNNKYLCIRYYWSPLSGYHVKLIYFYLNSVSVERYSPLKIYRFFHIFSLLDTWDYPLLCEKWWKWGFFSVYSFIWIPPMVDVVMGNGYHHEDFYNSVRFHVAFVIIWLRCKEYRNGESQSFH